MSKREQKKDLLLDTGLTVMATHGYNGTSIKDIVDAAEVPKGSFYTYFKSKEDFALAALERATEEREQESRALLQNRDIPPLERLTRYFRDYTGACDSGVTGGCFIGNMCQEMSDSSEQIRLKVRQLLRNNTQAIEDVLEAPQRQPDQPPVLRGVGRVPVQRLGGHGDANESLQVSPAPGRVPGPAAHGGGAGGRRLIPRPVCERPL